MEKARVLIVDNEGKLSCDFFKDCIRYFCRDFEIEFLAANDLDDGIGKLSPDLVIFSISAPKCTSVILQNLREKMTGDSGISKIPFLMVAGDIKDAKDAMGLVGESHILIKPAKPDILAFVVNDILNRKQ